MKLLLIGWAVFLIGTAVSAQTRVEVFSAEDHQPVKGVQLSFRDASGKEQWLLSDQQGAFQLPDYFHTLSCVLSVKLLHAEYQELNDSLYCARSKQFLLYPHAKDVDEVVITAQLGATKVTDAIHKVKIIDQQTILAKGAVNLRDLLQNELTIRIAQDQILGSGVSIQGLGGEGVKVLIDGVPVIGRQNGNIDLSQISLLNIERVEMVEGPLSVAYGSNAMAGTINLITKKVKTPGVTGNLTTYYETIGNYNLGASLAYTQKRHTLSVNLGRNFFDGWNASEPWLILPKERLADSGRFQQWKPKEQYLFGATYTYRWSRGALTPYFDGFTETIWNRGYPRPPYQIVAFDDTYFTRRLNQGVQLEQKTGRNGFLKSQVAYNDYYRVKQTYVKDLTTLEQELSATSGDQDTAGFQLYFMRTVFARFKKDAVLNYEVGVDLNHEVGQGKRMQNGEQQLTDAGIFSTADVRLRKWGIVKPGLRFTCNSVYGNALLPSVNVKLGKEKHQFRASVAQGFRSPGLKELYMDFVDVNHNIIGNDQLKPEKSTHMQGGYCYTKTWKKWTIGAEASLFYQYVLDRISLSQDATGVYYTYFNMDEFYSKGIQSDFKLHYLNWTGKAGVNYLGTASNYTQKQFYYSPEISASLQYGWKKRGLDFSVFYKYNGKVQSYTTDSEAVVSELYLQAYHLLDGQVQYLCWKEKLRFALGVKNALNVTNVAGLSATGAHTSGGITTAIATGRSFYVRLNYQIGKKR